MSKFYCCPTCGFAYHEKLAKYYDMECKRCGAKLKLRSDKD